MQIIRLNAMKTQRNHAAARVIIACVASKRKHAAVKELIVGAAKQDQHVEKQIKCA